MLNHYIWLKKAFTFGELSMIRMTASCLLAFAYTVNLFIDILAYLRGELWYTWTFICLHCCYYGYFIDPCVNWCVGPFSIFFSL